MKVHNLYKKGRGLFYYINEIEDLPLTELNEDITVEVIDLLFIALHGNKETNQMVKNITLHGEEVTPEELRQLATMLYAIHFKKWKNLYNIYLKEVPTETYRLLTTETEKEDGEVTNQSTDSSNTERTDKVTGFDSDTMTDKGAEALTEDEAHDSTSTSSINKEITKEVIGNTNNAIEDRAKAIEQVKNEVLIKEIFTDVVATIALLIY